jgi:hypothetical protein
MRRQEESIKMIIKFANLLIGGAIFFCVGILLYSVYYYHWTHERHFTSPIGPILYYVLPATLACLLLVSLRLEPFYRFKLCLLVFSIGTVIYSAELLLTFITPTPRTQLGVVMDLEKQNINAVPTLALPYLVSSGAVLKSEFIINGNEILPLGGIANKVTVFCNESGTWILYESDEHGFHNPKGIWEAGPVAIAALGDSCTQGECVPSHTNIVALIRKHYPTTLNLGLRGNGPLAELATLKEYVPAIKPKVLLWFYYEGNDLADLIREKANLLLRSYLRDNFTQDLLHRQTDIDQMLTTYVEARKHAMRLHKRAISQLTDRAVAIMKLTQVRQRLELVYGSNDERDQRDKQEEVNRAVDLFGEILSQAKAFVDAWGGTLYFVYLPDWARYAHPRSINKEDNYQAWALASIKTRDRVLRSVRTLGLPVIDIHDVFQAQNDPLALFRYQRSSHYNEEGYRLVAEEVLRALSLVDLKLW